MPRVLFWLLTILFALLVGACGGGLEDDPGPSVTAPPGLEPVATLGAPEGKLRLLAPPGYVPANATGGLGCQVQTEVAGSSDELVRRFTAGGFDGVLGTGDVTVRLIGAQAIAPINAELVPGYEDVFEGLKEQPYNSVGEQLFALPVGRAANLLVYRRAAIPGSLASIGAVLDPPQVAALGAQVTVPDDPHAIAEAALWVARKRKDLEITDPYELDRRQFDAVIEILRLQKPYVSEYWSDPQAVARSFRTGRAIAGLARQSVVADLEARPGPGGPVAATRPREGALGESPAWMVAADAEHPNCMYAWLARALEPAVNADVAEAADIAPSVAAACELIPEHCEAFDAADDGLYKRVLFRTYPSADCGDERGRVCMDYEEWVRAWRDVRDG
jgi:putative spermidine/putrescine transport system substrate-binding protein